MTPKERKVVFTLIGVMFLIMVSVIIMKSSKGAGDNEPNKPSKQETEMQNMVGFMQNAVSGNTNNSDSNNIENTVTNNTDDTDDTDSTNSNNTFNVKTYKTILITNIEYQNNNVGNKIVADITNISNSNFTSEVAKLILTTSSGEQVQTTIVIPSLEANGTAKLEHILDVDNVIDFIIEEI